MEKVNCFCGSGKTREDCCEKFIEGKAIPLTPEELMRSRFIAFATAKPDYLMETEILKFANTRKKLLRACQSSRWKGLRVLSSAHNETDGNVVFEVNLVRMGKNIMLRESSTFKFIEDRWFYTGGKSSWTETKSKGIKLAKRNDPCPCGSEKKYRHCCLPKHQNRNI